MTSYNDLQNRHFEESNYILTKVASQICLHKKMYLKSLPTQEREDKSWGIKNIINLQNQISHLFLKRKRIKIRNKELN